MDEKLLWKEDEHDHTPVESSSGLTSLDHSFEGFAITARLEIDLRIDRGKNYPKYEERVSESMT